MESNLDEPHKRIVDLCDAVGLDSSTEDTAMSVYGEANIDGGYAEDGVPGVVYAAVRIRGDPVKPTEIADACDTEANRIMRDMRRMVADLPFKVEFEGVERRYVERYADELDVDDQFKSTALSLCDDAVDGGLHNGKAPSAFAASVVYAASYVLDAGVEQADVASVADVSVTIIRRYYRKVIAASNDTAASPDDIPAIVDHVIDGIGGAIPDAVRHDAKEMSHAIDPDADWVRRCDPKAVAAAVVYVAAKRNRVDVTQAEAGEPVGMSRHAVNARSQDVKEWDTRRRLEDANYNRLKELAAENGAGVGSTPERDVLIDVLAELGVEP